MARKNSRRCRPSLADLLRLELKSQRQHAADLERRLDELERRLAVQERRPATVHHHTPAPAPWRPAWYTSEFGRS